MYSVDEFANLRCGSMYFPAKKKRNKERKKINPDPENPQDPEVVELQELMNQQPLPNAPPEKSQISKPLSRPQTPIESLSTCCPPSLHGSGVSFPEFEPPSNASQSIVTEKGDTTAKRYSLEPVQIDLSLKSGEFSRRSPVVWDTNEGYGQPPAGVPPAQPEGLEEDPAKHERLFS